MERWGHRDVLWRYTHCRKSTARCISRGRKLTKLEGGGEGCEGLADKKGLPTTHVIIKEGWDLV